MADSVTYEEFVKQENKRSGKDDISPSDTETTAIEDLQSTISEVQDNVNNLTHKTKQDQLYHQWEHQQLKATFTEYQEMMNHQLEGYQTVMKEKLETYATRIQELESQMHKPSTDSDSSVWEINSSSSDSEP
jgi:hypothetical protein